MDNITTFEPDALCPELHNKLVPFFQTMDTENYTTPELVDQFLEFMKYRGLAVVGRICTVEIDTGAASPEVVSGIESWKDQWSHNFVEPISIIHDKCVKFTFEPPCAHKNVVV
jgi:hypothetical protein